MHCRWVFHSKDLLWFIFLEADQVSCFCVTSTHFHIYQYMYQLPPVYFWERMSLESLSHSMSRYWKTLLYTWQAVQIRKISAIYVDARAARTRSHNDIQFCDYLMLWPELPVRRRLSVPSRWPLRHVSHGRPSPTRLEPEGETSRCTYNL